jgi:hypothetical protein
MVAKCIGAVTVEPKATLRKKNEYRLTMSDTIKNTRLLISNLGGSELKAVASNEGLQELFKQKQALIAEMNRAKRAAADQAAEPYLAAIDEIDNAYAVMLTFLGNNQNKD